MSSIDDYLKKNGRPHLSIVPSDGGGSPLPDPRLQARLAAIANTPAPTHSVAEARAAFGAAPPTPAQLSTPQGKALRAHETDYSGVKERLAPKPPAPDASALRNYQPDDSALRERLSARPAQPAPAPAQANAKFSRIAQAAEQAVAAPPAPAAAPAPAAPSNVSAMPRPAAPAAAPMPRGVATPPPPRVGNPSMVSKLRQMVGLVDGQAGSATVGSSLNGGRMTPTAATKAAVPGAAKAPAQPGAMSRMAQQAFGSAADWKQAGSKIAGAAGKTGGMASKVASTLGAVAKSPAARVGGAALGGVMGVMEVADGIEQGDKGKIALGALDTAASAALFSPAAPAAATYLGARGAYNVIDSNLTEDNKDTIGGTINEVVRGAGKLVGQDWGVDGTNYEVMRAQAAARQQAAAAPNAKPADKPADKPATPAAAPGAPAAAPANGAGTGRTGGAGGGRGGGAGGAGGSGRGRKIAAAATAAAVPAAAQALPPEVEALAAQVTEVHGGMGPDGVDRGTIYTLADGSKFAATDAMTPEQQAIVAAHQARLAHETELYMQQIAAGERQEPVVIRGGMATTMSGVTMPQSVYEAGMARQYADTANQAAVRNADPIAAEAALFKETEGATRQAVANTQAGAQIRAAQIAAENERKRLEMEQKRRYQKVGGGTDRDTGFKNPDMVFDEKEGKYIDSRPPTMPIPDEAAIKYLKKNPQTAPQFDQTYGAGAAERYYRN